MRKFLALIVEQDSTVVFSSRDAQAALHQIDLSTGTAGAPQAAPLDGVTPTDLRPGLHVATADHKLTCKLCSGEVTIVVLGGEDPWPVPPAKLLANVSTAALSQLLQQWP